MKMKRNVSCISTTNSATITVARSLSVIETNDNNERKKRTTTTTTAQDGLNILIVDDNPININILNKSLNKIFNKSTMQIKRLEEASNGVEALNLLNHFHFDIILLDIDMPILNGIDTTKCIREKGQTIPIIAVTTNDSIESRDNYIKIGMVCIQYIHYDDYILLTHIVE
jgi:CheY-like chemotaxis protein